MVNDSKFQTTNQTICQQMSIPLTYGNGINLLPKRCDQDEAYFACSISRKLTFASLKAHSFFNVKSFADLSLLIEFY